MNAYICQLLVDIRRDYYVEYFGGTGYSEWIRPIEIIFAETRGKARASFTNRYDLEFIDPDVSIKLVEKCVDSPAGFASDADPLWAHAWEVVS